MNLYHILGGFGCFSLVLFFVVSIFWADEYATRNRLRKPVRANLAAMYELLSILLFVVGGIWLFSCMIYELTK